MNSKPSSVIVNEEGGQRALRTTLIAGNGLCTAHSMNPCTKKDTPTKATNCIYEAQAMRVDGWWIDRRWVHRLAIGHKDRGGGVSRETLKKRAPTTLLRLLTRTASALFTNDRIALDKPPSCRSSQERSLSTFPRLEHADDAFVTRTRFRAHARLSPPLDARPLPDLRQHAERGGYRYRPSWTRNTIHTIAED
ncbi:uncharacterized protein M421DRAFT_182164 [Didymella exigua CBS 183.55]|uniref:Uncharacterized protein n=1 Tax=Didymella exigua CBS 183.55 TaxID=1150837 RepID=A0A6A5RH80_9PLEO|nr:uncharacterized protein M421DRAFT_182164 [Didymella exigua CBS 183.55]KAF1927122.1 hypothetical protein M421DRAFT_182164 [Didymella exigua CBS 183.55]